MMKTLGLGNGRARRPRPGGRMFVRGRAYHHREMMLSKGVSGFTSSMDGAFKRLAVRTSA